MAAGAGAGAGAAFSFLTLEAGFLGMVACKWARLRRCTWGEVGALRAAGMPIRWAQLPLPRACRLRPARGREKRGDARRASWRCARRRRVRRGARVLGCPLEAGVTGPSFTEFTCFYVRGAVSVAV